LPQPRCN